jgi:hypothetical protein
LPVGHPLLVVGGELRERGRLVIDGVAAQALPGARRDLSGRVADVELLALNGRRGFRAEEAVVLARLGVEAPPVTARQELRHRQAVVGAGSPCLKEANC